MQQTLLEFPDVTRYEIRLSQLGNEYSAERTSAGVILISGSQLEDENFDPGIDATLELIHGKSDGTEEIVATYDELYPLPDPAALDDVGLDGGGAKGSNSIDPLDLLPDGTLELDSNGDIVQAVDQTTFGDGAPCAVLQEGLPILTPPIDYVDSWQQGNIGWKAVGYMWVSNGARVDTTGSISPRPWNYSHGPPIAQMQVWVSPSGLLEHQSAYNGYQTSEIDRNSPPYTYGLPWADDMDNLISQVPTGKYYPVGAGANVSSSFAWNLEIDIAPPLYPWYNYPVEEPCTVFSDLGLALEHLEVELGFVDSALNAVVIVAGVAVEFVPGYDCYDAIVNGVNGWNAVGCTADLIGAGITMDILRGLDNLQFVARRNDEIVGAIKNVDADSLADDLIAASASLCSSFSPDTGVLLADGSVREIGEVRAGDRVLSYDQSTGENVDAEVIAAWSHPDWVATATTDGGSISITSDHPVWNATDQQWQPIREIEVGHSLLGADGAQPVLLNLSDDSSELSNVYDVSVADTANFYVQVGDGSILVHNNAAGCPLAARLGGNAGEVAEQAPDLVNPILNLANGTTDEVASSVVNILSKKNLSSLTTDETTRLADIIANADDADVLKWLDDKPIRDATNLCESAGGGVYTVSTLVGGVQTVIYVGETTDFVTRRAAHTSASSPLFSGINIEFDEVYAVADHDVRRGLEQAHFDELWRLPGEDPITYQQAQARGSVNRQRPMAIDRDVLPQRSQYANAYKKVCGAT